MPNTDFYRKMYGGMAEGTIEIQRRGPTNQRGNGFFGRVIRGSLAPIIRSVLPYLKNMALEGVGGLVSELKEGKSVKEAATTQLKRSASTLAEDMAGKIKRRMTQAGAGIKRLKVRKRGAQSRKTKSPKGLFPI